MANNTPVWSEINLAAIAHNIRQLKNITRPDAELMAVVKANAYGHGAGQVARVAMENGATRLGVARVSEGEALRRAGIDAPLLILGYTVPEDYPSLLANDLAQTVYSLAAARELSATAARAGKKAVVHIKVDTGMGRLGFCIDKEAVKEAVREITAIAKLPHLEVEGIYTHFAAADSRDKSYTIKQWRKFNELLEALSREGLAFLYRHAANSAALIDLPETHLDLVRAGIAIYGVYPSNEVLTERVSLKPAMAVKARVAHVKRVPAGTGISYGVTHITPKDTLVATIPAGYADGYSRLLSSRGEVLLRGRRAPVIGRVCMDQFMVDVGHLSDVEPGEEVVLMGRQGDDMVSADEIAGKIGTIAYEVLCMVSARVPRYYVSG
ncbi:alanine racemase [Desulfoscipio geothermicus]|uniref:Alanine racemase n=1 Tax=Desulfoscipio geothermicus DSM 3669 TaxID=1121426 RepID=A0A1I6DT29_9FIRM|nr:alanine racemase [Desulfoscipio geothermicus]SFR08605.1 alanine racemase [Desulfoscipio geothermicus DSM 3669]